MATKIFPSLNDVGLAIGDGRVPTEESLSRLQWDSAPQISGSRRGDEQFSSGGVISGFDVSSVSGLVATLNSGLASIEGYHMEETATTDTPALTASVFNWVFLALTRDGSDNVTGIEIQVSTSATFSAALSSVPADAILIHCFETDATDIITQLDFRGSPSNTLVGSYVGDGAATRTIDLGARPKLVKITKLTAPRLVCYSEMLSPFPTSSQYGMHFFEYDDDQGMAVGIDNSRELRPQLEANGFSVEDGPGTVAPGGILYALDPAYNPPNILAGTIHTRAVTVTGARVGDVAHVNVDSSRVSTDLLIEAHVTADDTVSVDFKAIGGAVNPGAADIRVAVITSPRNTGGYELNTNSSFYFFTAWF